MCNRLEKGFTLIELVIVIAIIGVIAAIATPVYSYFRIKAFDATVIAAISDINKYQADLYGSYSEYGTTRSIKYYKSGDKKGEVVNDSGFLMTSNNSRNNPQRVAISVTPQVGVIVSADKSFKSYVITAKHLGSDKRFCYDSDDQAFYYDYKYNIGKPLTKSAAITAKLKRKDCKRKRGMNPM